MSHPPCFVVDDTPGVQRDPQGSQATRGDKVVQREAVEVDRR